MCTRLKTTYCCLQYYIAQEVQIKHYYNIHNKRLEEDYIKVGIITSI